MYSGVFEGRKGAPSSYFAGKYSSFLVKNILSAFIIFSEPRDNSVLCRQSGPQEQLQRVIRLLCFQRDPNNNNCNVQVCLV